MAGKTRSRTWPGGSIGGLVGLATAWAPRKVLGFAWEKTTGKKPPADRDSPRSAWARRSVTPW